MPDGDEAEGESAASTTGSDPPSRPDGPNGSPNPRLASRVLVTWIELTLVGLLGGLVADGVGGPPGFIVYLCTTLLAVGVLFYNVDAFVDRKLTGPSSGS